MQAVPAPTGKIFRVRKEAPVPVRIVGGKPEMTVTTIHPDKPAAPAPTGKILQARKAVPAPVRIAGGKPDMTVTIIHPARQAVPVPTGKTLRVRKEAPEPVLIVKEMQMLIGDASGAMSMLKREGQGVIWRLAVRPCSSVPVPALMPWTVMATNY